MGTKTHHDTHKLSTLLLENKYCDPLSNALTIVLFFKPSKGTAIMISLCTYQFSSYFHTCSREQRLIFFFNANNIHNSMDIYRIHSKLRTFIHSSFVPKFVAIELHFITTLQSVRKEIEAPPPRRRPTA